jgi:hypothetical protein
MAINNGLAQINREGSGHGTISSRGKTVRASAPG